MKAFEYLLSLSNIDFQIFGHSIIEQFKLKFFYLAILSNECEWMVMLWKGYISTARRVTSEIQHTHFRLSGLLGIWFGLSWAMYLYNQYIAMRRPSEPAYKTGPILIQPCPHKLSPMHYQLLADVQRKCKSVLGSVIFSDSS